jgi:hypothetical protein
MMPRALSLETAIKEGLVSLGKGGNCDATLAFARRVGLGARNRGPERPPAGPNKGSGAEKRAKGAVDTTRPVPSTKHTKITPLPPGS